MSFLTPLFLAGLLALAVPILIHLQRRQQRRHQTFPSLMFLRSVRIPSMRRRWIRNWLLLALRCLALALLVLAFARPWLRAGAMDPTAGREGRALVVLLDNSFSMGFADRWSRALEAARQELATVDGADEASVVVFSDYATVLGEPSSEPLSLQQALAKVTLSSRTTRYGPAFRMARKLLLESDRPHREVVLLTDFQRTGRDSDARLPLPVGTELRFVDLSGRERHGVSPANLAIASIAFDHDSSIERERVEVQVRVANRGQSALPAVRIAPWLKNSPESQPRRIFC